MIRFFHHACISVLALLVRAVPDSARGWHALARSYTRAISDQQADRAYDRAIRLYAAPPQTNETILARCLVERAHGLMRQEQPDQAATLYHWALCLTPHDPDVSFALANSLFAIGNYSSAQRFYKTALTLRPNHHRAWFNLGHTLKAKDALGDAVHCFERAISLNTRFVKARFMRAYVLSLLRRHEEAIAEYERTLSMSPRYVKAHFNLGNCHLEYGHHVRAIRCYETALKIDPTYDKAWFALGQAARRVQNLSLAREAYAKALALRPDMYQCRLQLARLLETLGDRANAALHYRVYLQDAPESDTRNAVHDTLQGFLSTYRASKNVRHKPRS